MLNYFEKIDKSSSSYLFQATRWWTYYVCPKIKMSFSTCGSRLVFLSFATWDQVDLMKRNICPATGKVGNFRPTKMFCEKVAHLL